MEDAQESGYLEIGNFIETSIMDDFFIHLTGLEGRTFLGKNIVELLNC
jgi:hypothetical protein